MIFQLREPPVKPYFESGRKAAESLQRILTLLKTGDRRTIKREDLFALAYAEITHTLTRYQNINSF